MSNKPAIGEKFQITVTLLRVFTNGMAQISLPNGTFVEMHKEHLGFGDKTQEESLQEVEEEEEMVSTSGKKK